MDEFLRRRAAGALLLVLLPLVAVAEVTDAWVREAPPGVRMLAGYLEYRNDGEREVAIVGAESEAFRSVSLHRTVERDGLSRMEPAGELVLAPGEVLRFEPGGLHLMLMGPQRDLRAGDRVSIGLERADGLVEWAEFEVRGLD